ncbi:TPA: restriction endonuclease subunit S [Vibrio alginolyticus]|uniref:restriction endonuclease subunit S n=1 Tax=Vibrio cholerae TaxID=666 RepID=UPI000D220B3F|nr:MULTISPECIES: restriction endonuclease subunit S [Vibrio]AVW96700.1 restriction endonuclease [Vibrio parahaemolyticus]EGQ8737560.1 restriction endonuclease subunit S [Vibrio parahaemolyticus]EGQ8907360.1 restriction endonuclease subunit S [Vibrio parahaemolyticus]EGR3100058.1 restriction endonuclease subunit S [Vibrio parahaemolyticus]EJG0273053.1 restriction endonuclease subunit S [Vibrio parahaemolyticus]
MTTKLLSELSTNISSGLTPLRSNPEFWDNGTIPWLKTEQLGEKYIYETNEHISKAALDKTSIKTFPENSLSIAMYGEGKTRGNLSILKKPMATNQACCNVVIDPEKADFEYVYYFLKTQYEELRNLSSGVRKNLNSNDIKNYPIRLPENLDEQKKIANVLKVLDTKIELNNRINIELEAMAKTLYDYWFVQFDFPDANGKPYKASGGKMVYDSVLKQEIPADWHVNAISDWIRSDKTGDWGKEAKQGNYTLQVDCIRGADINGINGKGNVDAPNRFILEKNEQKLLAPFDFVIEISGGSPTQSTGRMAFITEHVLERFDYPLICSNFCKAIDLIDKSYFYNFAYQWQSLYENGVLFGWEGKTSGIKNLLFDSFVSNYNVVMPPKELAEKFFQFVSPVQEQKQKKLKENAELEGLRDWLLPMLMNGQVTVKPSTESKEAQHG